MCRHWRTRICNCQQALRANRRCAPTGATRRAGRCAPHTAFGRASPRFARPSATRALKIPAARPGGRAAFGRAAAFYSIYYMQKKTPFSIFSGVGRKVFAGLCSGDQAQHFIKLNHLNRSTFRF